MRPAPTTMALIPERTAELATRKRVGHERRRRREHERAADALDDPAEDQGHRVRSDPAADRGEGEDDHPDHVGPRPPELVREAPRVQHEDGGHDRVPDDDPQQREQVRVEVAEDVGQGDDQRPRRQRRKQRTEARDRQQPPPVVGGRGVNEATPGERRRGHDVPNLQAIGDFGGRSIPDLPRSPSSAGGARQGPTSAAWRASMYVP